jgi:hypothetical protein
MIFKYGAKVAKIIGLSDGETFLCPFRLFPKNGLSAFKEPEKTLKHGIVHSNKIKWGVDEFQACRFVL